jgi:hypothetical protein
VFFSSGAGSDEKHLLGVPKWVEMRVRACRPLRATNTLAATTLKFIAARLAGMDFFEQRLMGIRSDEPHFAWAKVRELILECRKTLSDAEQER